jgi:GDPmannose 4,6-dehydratase
MRKVALITGVTGQDGSYLAELLLGKGYEVHGIRRRSSSFDNTNRIKNIISDEHSTNKGLQLHYGDMLDGVNIVNLLREIQPTEIYNLAAQSHVHISFTIPEYTANVDALGTIRILEAIRAADLETKFYQASTSELFGSTPPPQSELSSFNPRSPYAAAKLYSYFVTKNYREAFGIFAVNGILFNHESPRRGETFVTRKISKGVADIASGKKKNLYLGELDSIRDWGYAPEYVEGMWKMLQHEDPIDMVLATGVGATVEDFCKEAFNRCNLDYKKYIKIDPKYFRPTEVNALVGNAKLAEEKIGWVAKTKWDEIARIMVDYDLGAEKL